MSHLLRMLEKNKETMVIIAKNKIAPVSGSRKISKDGIKNKIKTPVRLWIPEPSRYTQ